MLLEQEIVIQKFIPLSVFLHTVTFINLLIASGTSQQSHNGDPTAALTGGSLEVLVPKTYFTGRMGDPSARIIRQYQWSPLLGEFNGDFPGFDLRFHALDRDEFVQAVHSPEQNPPDVMFVDNASELDPLMESNAVIKMQGSSRFHANGWWLIFRNSKNVLAGKAFLIWLSQSPHWQPWQLKTAPMQAADTNAVQQISVEAFTDYLRPEPKSLALLMDPQASRFYRLAENETLTNVDPLVTFGNSKTAFVLLSAVCQHDQNFGMVHSALVLRKVAGSWKVLLFIDGSLPGLESILKSFDNLKMQDGPAELLASVTLLSPVDHAKTTRYPRGELAWESLNVALSTYLIESQHSNPEQANWSLSRIQLVPQTDGQPQVHFETPFGAGMQPHRWRVWAISKTGDISISDWRTIDFTN